MYSVNILYDDGKTFTCNNVVSIQYDDANGIVTVPAEKFSNHRFPIPRTYWLQTQDGMCVANLTGMRIFELIKN